MVSNCDGYLREIKSQDEHKHLVSFLETQDSAIPDNETNLLGFFANGRKQKNSETNTTRYNLNKSATSWVTVSMLQKNLMPTEEEMDQLWNLHPVEKGTVKIMGKIVETPRWQQSYGKSYRFSGMNHESLPIPPLVQKYLDYANSLVYTKPFQFEFNMALLNWYEDGSMYIGPHSDDESEMEKTAKGETVVFSISLGQERDFKFIPKNKEEEGDIALKIPMPHGTVIVMGGTCQKTHKHAVPKVTGKKAEGMKPRINITFRIFRDS